MSDLYYVHIIKYEGDEVVKSMGPRSRRTAERIDDGANINLNHDGYYTMIVTEEVEKARLAKLAQKEAK